MRAAPQAVFHSGLRANTPHEVMNAGQAWRRSSRSHPGSAAKLAGVISGAGSAFTGGVGGGATGGSGGGSTRSTGGGMTTGGGAGLGSGVPHAARASATAPAETSRLLRVENMGVDMWVLMLEAGVAFFLLVFIVWWTMYSGPKPTNNDRQLNAPEKKEELPDDTSR